MTIETIEFKNATDDQLEITMRGKADYIALVLVNGLPREALQQVWEAMEVELTARKARADADPPGSASPDG